MPVQDRLLKDLKSWGHMSLTGRHMIFLLPYLLLAASLTSLTAVFTAFGNYYTFLFSPQSNGDGESITTYFQFVVNTYWADGDSHKVNNDYGGENLDHQDDYFLVYEDPVHYYSYHNEPQSGSFVVSMGNDGNPKSVMLDVRLADGTPLKVNYSGKFETTEDASAE